MITKVRTVGIYVNDQQRAVDFYVDKVGFEKRRDEPMTPEPDAPRWIELKPPHGQTLLVPFTSPGQEERIGGFSNVVFACDDIQATYEELAALGVEFPNPPSQQAWGMWATFRDPDGNEFGLAEHPD